MREKLRKLFRKFSLLSREFFAMPQEEQKIGDKEEVKHNLAKFIDAEKRELKELINGQESLSKYSHDSFSLFKDYFIPGDSNNNRPRILRPRQLTTIAIFLVLLKVLLVGYVFSVYQQEAIMSETAVSQMLALTNESRVGSGVNPVSLNSALSQAAQIKAEDMVINNYFAHTSPDGRRPWNFVSRNQYPYILIGENLAMNFLGASDAHFALMASPSHQKNILNPKYTDLGIAVIEGEINGEETNILVEMFGARTEPIAPKIETTAPAPVAEPAIASDAAAPVSSVLVKADLDEVQTSPAAVVEVKNTVAPEPQDSPTPSQGSGVNSVSSPLSPEENTSAYLPDSNAATSSNEAQEMPTLAADSFQEIAASEEIATSPNLIEVEPDFSVHRALSLIQIAKIIYIAFLIFLIVALIINIMVRITVQHKSIIIPTLLLIALILVLIFFDFGFIKQLQQTAWQVAIF